MQISTFVRVLFLCSLGFASSESPVGDVVGYQGWFAVQGDGSPMNHWFHWGDKQGPSQNHLKFELWPDVREYNHTYATHFQPLGNGQPAKLFSSWDDQTVDTHFRWMKEYNIDTAALQRFVGGVKKDPVYGHLNGIASKVKAAAEHNNRKFYIMYDISGWDAFASELIPDMHTNLKPLGIFNSTAYAHQNGKPVVCVCLDVNGMVHVIQELKKEGYYVIGGVDTHWLKEPTLQKFHPAYLELNMLQPWIVGCYNGVTGAKNYKSTIHEDNEFLKKHNIDLQVVTYPDSAWSNKHPNSKQNDCPRLHGNFLWQQFMNLRELGLRNAYVAMFDEYDEETAIAKAAETKHDIPQDQ